jgi:hypothetical protein
MPLDAPVMMMTLSVIVHNHDVNYSQWYSAFVDHKSSFAAFHSSRRLPTGTATPDRRLLAFHAKGVSAPVTSR